MSLGDAPKVKAPPVQPPMAIPEVGEEGKDIARRKRSRSGGKTVITGDLVPETNKKKLLG